MYLMASYSKISMRSFYCNRKYKINENEQCVIIVIAPRLFSLLTSSTEPFAIETISVHCL